MLNRRSLRTTTNLQALHALNRSPDHNRLLLKELPQRDRSSIYNAQLRSLHNSALLISISTLSQSRLRPNFRRVSRRQAKRVVTRSWSSLGAFYAWHTDPNNMASGSASADKKGEKSSWASAVDSINPWAGSRSSTPVPREPVPPPPPPPNPGNSGGDHSINLIYGLSARKYPADCPPLKVKWFHAVDVWTVYCPLLVSILADEHFDTRFRNESHSLSAVSKRSPKMQSLSLSRRNGSPFLPTTPVPSKPHIKAFSRPRSTSRTERTQFRGKPQQRVEG